MASNLHGRLRFVKRGLRRGGVGSCGAITIALEPLDVAAPKQRRLVFALAADRRGEVGVVDDGGDALATDPENLAYLEATYDCVFLGRRFHSSGVYCSPCGWSSVGCAVAFFPAIACLTVRLPMTSAILSRGAELHRFSNWSASLKMRWKPV